MQVVDQTFTALFPSQHFPLPCASAVSSSTQSMWSSCGRVGASRRLPVRLIRFVSLEAIEAVEAIEAIIGVTSMLSSNPVVLSCKTPAELLIPHG